MDEVWKAVQAQFWARYAESLFLNEVKPAVIVLVRNPSTLPI